MLPGPGWVPKEFAIVRMELNMCASCVWGWDATGGTLFAASGALPFSLPSSNSHCALVEEGRNVGGMACLRSSSPGLALVSQSGIVSPRPVSCDHRAASFASAMAMMTSSRAAPRAHQGVFQMEKPVAEPGAVVAGRIAGQAHDRVPQFGEAFSQIFHVAGSLACAGPCFRQEPAGIGPASRPLC